MTTITEEEQSDELVIGLERSMLEDLSQVEMIELFDDPIEDFDPCPRPRHEHLPHSWVTYGELEWR